MPQNLKFSVSISFTYKFEIKLNFQIKLLICLKEVGELNMSCFFTDRLSGTMNNYPIQSTTEAMLLARELLFILPIVK